MIRVSVISSTCLYRDGLSRMLARCNKVQVVGSAAAIDSAIEGCRVADSPYVILLDTTGVDVRGAVELVHEALPGTHVVALTVPNREQEMLAHVEAGVDGFVTVEASFRDLVAAIESAARGEALCHPSVTAALMRRLAARTREGPNTNPARILTPREREIVDLIDGGLSNKQIARRLRIELPTVKNHVHHILAKLGVERRSEAAAFVRAAGA